MSLSRVEEGRVQRGAHNDEENNNKGKGKCEKEESFKGLARVSYSLLMIENFTPLTPYEASNRL
uniref:Uncharacterized protein n=1 Tax=Rhizophagus irregularis (strain DAOM 181602 / DAOM 197198 / MUCL 43194) TaxID=747089 RepID=U9UQI2_RHIID